VVGMALIPGNFLGYASPKNERHHLSLLDASLDFLQLEKSNESTSKGILYYFL
jgi:hypothetical protein